MTVLEAVDLRFDQHEIDSLLAAKRDQRIVACIPARDEATTIGDIAAILHGVRSLGLIDDVVVVDDGSTDTTASRAKAEGARVIHSRGGPGKGQAVAAAVAATRAEMLVLLDADVTNFSDRFVIGLVAPLLGDSAVQLAKATYRRPLDGVGDQGGRVTELLARPLLRRFFPELADLAQPLAGECAVRRGALEGLVLADGYGIEIGLLIDLYRSHGRDAIVEADLGERVHRNRPLHDLRPHADDVLAALADRVDPSAWNRRCNP